MLVLTRKLGEEILISGIVTVKILKVQGKQISIGIDAPKEVSILRKELTDGSGQVNHSDS